MVERGANGSHDINRDETRTSILGRDPKRDGFPPHIAEISATLKGVAYSARVSVHTPANFMLAKKAVRTAIQKQIDGVGFGIVEFLSACPIDWGLSPAECLKFINDAMVVEFPLGEYKNVNSIDYSIPINKEVARINVRSGA